MSCPRFTFFDPLARRGLWAVLPLVGVAGSAQAQSSLSADADRAARALQQEAERDRALRAQQPAAPDVRLSSSRPGAAGAGRLPTDESPCFPVTRLELTGDDHERFAWVLPAADRTADGQPDPATPRCLDTQGVQRVMARLQNAIVERGFVTTRVLAPPQDLAANQRLVLAVVPGRVRQVRVSGTSDARANPWNAVPLREGDLLDLREVEQSLENLRRVPTAQVDLRIEPVEDGAPGQSDLVVDWHQPSPFRLSLSADDGGSRATGRYQGAATLSIDHPTGLNDLFYLTVLGNLDGGSSAHGTGGHTLHYSVPWHRWLLSLTSSWHRYRQNVAGSAQDYRYSGTSRNEEVGLSRLLHRDAVRKTTLTVRAWGRESANFVDDTEVQVQHRRTAGWGLALGHRAFIGASTLEANLDWRQATGARNALDAPEDAFGEGASRPRILGADASVSLPGSVAGQRIRYNAAWRAQWSPTALVPQDRFAIGGRYTVRGFDGERVLSGQRGWLVRNDLSWGLGDSAQELFVGLDHGRVSGAGTEDLPGTRLTGAVLGLRGLLGRVQYELFAGGPLAHPSGFQAAGSVAGFSLMAAF